MPLARLIVPQQNCNVCVLHNALMVSPVHIMLIIHLPFQLYAVCGSSALPCLATYGLKISLDHQSGCMHCVVAVYVLDTGVRTSHVDFKGRVGAGASSVGSSVMDDNGHGTQVAGMRIALGGIHGVAKRAILHPVKVCCRIHTVGSTSTGTIQKMCA